MSTTPWTIYTTWGKMWCLFRLKCIHRLREQQERTTREADRLIAEAGAPFTLLPTKLDIPMMRFAQDLVYVEDTTIPDKLLAALPVFGPAPIIGFL